MYFQPGRSSKRSRHHLVHAVGRQRERLAEVRVADQRQRRQVVPDVQALRRLIAGEDVVELLDVQRRAVAVVDVALAHLVGKLLQPLHVLGRQQPRVQVQRVARRVVVVRIVHAAGDGGVVVAQDGVGGALADDRAAFVRAGAIADRVAQADALVDALVGRAHVARPRALRCSRACRKRCQFASNFGPIE